MDIYIINSGNGIDGMSGYANFYITDGTDVYWHAVQDLAPNLDREAVQADLDSRAASLWADAVANGLQMEPEDAQAFIDKTLLRAQQADDAIAAINAQLALLDPLAFDPLTNAAKTELIRASIVDIYQTLRKVIKWAKRQELGI